MLNKIVCICCPVGCKIEVVTAEAEIVSVSGYECKRGKGYAVQEMTAPKRVLTGNMRAKGAVKPFSVRSSSPMPKEMIRSSAQELKRHRPLPPIKINDIVIENILGSGCNIVATRDFIGERDD